MQSNANNDNQLLGNAYIPHPIAERAKSRIKLLFDAAPCKDHAWTGLLIGPTGSGKSAVARRFHEEQIKRDQLANFAGESVVRVRTPDHCSNLGLYRALLRALGDPLAATREVPLDCHGVALRLLSRKKAKLIIFDEAQHAVPRKGVKRDAYQVANFFKDIQDDSGVNLLFCGLESCRELIDNPQLASRAMIEATMTSFDWWKPDNEYEEREAFLNILCDLHAMMGIKIKAIDPTDDTKLELFDVTNDDFAWRLSHGSAGLLRAVVKFLTLLQLVAKQEDRSYISEEMFARVWDIIPSRDRVTTANPFLIKVKPGHWKAASGSEGDRK